MENLDYRKTVLSQFQNAVTLNYLLSGLAGMIQIASQEIIDKVLNVDTAEGAQLDAIGARIGVGRQMLFGPNLLVESKIGYDDTGWRGYDTSYGGTYDIAYQNNNIVLSDEGYRLYIKVAAYRNISNCSITSLNTMLANIFVGRGSTWIALEEPLKISFNFSFLLTQLERNLISNNYFAAPAGYSVIINENIGA
jgi:hypothetical protein